MFPVALCLDTIALGDSTVGVSSASELGTTDRGGVTGARSPSKSEIGGHLYLSFVRIGKASEVEEETRPLIGDKAKGQRERGRVNLRRYIQRCLTG